MLAATVVNHLYSDRGASDFLVFYFFVDGHSNDDTKTKALAVLSSLVCQLFYSRQLPKNDIVEHAFHNSLQVRGDFDSLWPVFSALLCLRLRHTTCIILDGIDECSDYNLLIPKLLDLVTTQESHLKLFFTSRATSEPDLYELLNGHSFIEVTRSKTRADLDIYVTTMTRRILGDSMREEEVESISSALRKSANGISVIFNLSDLI